MGGQYALARVLLRPAPTSITLVLASESVCSTSYTPHLIRGAAFATRRARAATPVLHTDLYLPRDTPVDPDSPRWPTTRDRNVVRWKAPMVPIPPALHVAPRSRYLSPKDTQRLVTELDPNQPHPHARLVGLLQAPAQGMVGALPRAVRALPDLLGRAADFNYLARIQKEQ